MSGAVTAPCQLFKPFGPRLLEKFQHGWTPTPARPVPKLLQARRDFLGIDRRPPAAQQRGAEDFPVLGLGRAAVLGRPGAQATDDILIQIPNRERGHGDLPCCQSQQ
jgi:hypothetical protein